MALELCMSGMGVWPSIELELTSKELASGSGVVLIWKPFFRPAGVVSLPFSRPLTCRVRFAVALFNMGVNSDRAAGFRNVARGFRGVDAWGRAPPICLKSASRPSGAWKVCSTLKSMSLIVRVMLASVTGDER